MRSATGPLHISLDDSVSINEDYSAHELPPIDSPDYLDLSALIGDRSVSVISEKSSRSSLRRQSLDAIQHLAETAPQTLADKLMNVYCASASPADDSDADIEDDGRASPSDIKLGRLSFFSVQSRQSVLSGTASSRSSAFIPPEERGELYSPLSPTFPVRRSNSLTHKRHSNGRQIKQGLKLANFFGTSEVLTHVLSSVFEDLNTEEEADLTIDQGEKAKFFARSQELEQSLLGRGCFMIFQVYQACNHGIQCFNLCSSFICLKALHSLKCSFLPAATL